MNGILRIIIKVYSASGLFAAASYLSSKEYFISLFEINVAKASLLRIDFGVDSI